MMISTKAMSSPGRTEKLAPPLMMRLLSRSNRSLKGKSRSSSSSSPLFILRSNCKKNNTHDHEPSSPKVTCIGQVRPTSSQPQNKTHRHRHRPCFCFWPKNKNCTNSNTLSLSCPHFFKPKWPCPAFAKWVGSFRVGWCGKVEVNRRTQMKDAEKEEVRLESCEGLNSSSVALQPPRNAFMLTRCRSSSYRGNDTEDQSVEKEEEAEVVLTRCRSSSYRGNEMEDQIVEKEKEEVEGKLEDSSVITSQPPKNAFLLTRCRSAPYRSSSLANSLLCECNEAEKVEEERETEDGDGGEKERETEGPTTSEVEPVNSVDGKATTGLVLTRCTSEPARTGERLIPVAGLWEGLLCTGPASAPRVNC